MSADDKHTNQYLEHHQQLLRNFNQEIQQQPPFNSDSLSEQDQSLLNDVQHLTQQSSLNNDDRYTGQQALCRIISGYSHLTPLLPRDLLWFFGGDCLHFMPDEEIQVFQQLEEAYYDAQASQQPFNYAQERDRRLNRH